MIVEPIPFAEMQRTRLINHVTLADAERPDRELAKERLSLAA